MNILFFQWRYHTNRHPMVKGFLKGGHDVKYISQYKNPNIENYEVLKPDVAGYSQIFLHIANVLGKDSSRIRKRFGWPPLRDIYREIRSFDPDIIIVRDYDFVSAIVLVIGKLFGAKGIVQEQLPKYRSNISWKKDLGHSLYNQIFNYPLLSVTPLEGNVTMNSREYIYYIPFPVDTEMYRPLNVPINEHDSKISIVSVGKFGQQRKNHIDLLEAFNNLTDEYNLNLTLIGYLENKDDPNYMRITNYIKRMNLDNKVTIKANMDHTKLQLEYKNHDLFVLPSKNEPAAISPLEAMAAGLPIITSDSNGTNCYIDDGKNGLIFRTGSVVDLQRKIRQIVNNKSKMRLMGKRSLEIVEENHTPQAYLNKMENMIEKEFGAI